MKIQDYSTADLQKAKEACLMYANGMVALGLEPYVAERIEEIETELNRREQA